MNFPTSYSQESISKICDEFGKVKSVDLVIDPNTGRFTGVVNVEYGSELDAKKACTGMIGLRIDNHYVLDVRKIVA